MKKLYTLILLTFVSLSGMTYAMEQDFPEDKQGKDDEIKELDQRIQELPEEIKLEILSYIGCISKDDFTNLVIAGDSERVALLAEINPQLVTDIISALSQDKDNADVATVALALAAMLTGEDNNCAMKLLHNALEKLGDDKEEFLKISMKRAVENGALKKMAILIALDPALVDTISENQDPFLLLAVTKNNLEVIKYLVDEHGANINVSDRDGVTALLLATMQGNKDIVKYLVDHGADVNASVKDKSALDIAEMLDHKEIAQYLREHGAKTAQELLKKEDFFQAVIDGDDDLVIKLVEIDPELVNARTDFGYSALMYAISNGHNNIANALLKNGAFVDDQGFSGKTALMEAAYQGNLEMVKTLIEQYGADKSITDKDGATALNYTSEYYPEVAAYLKNDLNRDE